MSYLHCSVYSEVWYKCLSLCNMALFTCRFNWLNGVMTCTVTLLLGASTVELCGINQWFENCLLSRCSTKLKNWVVIYFSGPRILIYSSLLICLHLRLWMSSTNYLTFTFISISLLFVASVCLDNCFIFSGSLCCCWQ